MNDAQRSRCCRSIIAFLLDVFATATCSTATTTGFTFSSSYSANSNALAANLALPLAIISEAAALAFDTTVLASSTAGDILPSPSELSAIVEVDDASLRAILARPRAASLRAAAEVDLSDESGVRWVLEGEGDGTTRGVVAKVAWRGRGLLGSWRGVKVLAAAGTRRVVVRSLVSLPRMASDWVLRTLRTRARGRGLMGMMPTSTGEA